MGEPLTQVQQWRKERLEKGYKAKGYITFGLCLDDDGEYQLRFRLYELEDILADRMKWLSDIPNLPDYEEAIEHLKEEVQLDNTYMIADLMDGIEFLEDVLDGSFIDYDGTLAEIFVDGYKSNLGLAAGGIEQGKFLVDENVFRMICEEYKVEVNWANK